MGERIGKITESIKQNSRKVGALAAIGGFGLFAVGCGTETHTLSEARQIADKKYVRAWDHASPAGKFLLQYLRVSYADVVKHKDDQFYVDSTYRFAFNDGCLGGTSYDIAGGEFNVSASASGFLTSASAHAQGKIPAAAASAYVSNRDPNILEVQSGHDHPYVLTFSGLEGNGKLVPATQQTENVLRTWGCHEGPKGYTVVGNLDQPSINPNLSIK